MQRTPVILSFVMGAAASALPQTWTPLDTASVRPSLTVMADPGRTSFTYGTPRVLRGLGYRVCVVQGVPAAPPLQQYFPVLLVERQHFTAEQYEELRDYVRHGGGLLLVGYAANWLDQDQNQVRDAPDPEIRVEGGSGGLTELVGGARIGVTGCLKQFIPVEGDPLVEGLAEVTFESPTMGDGMNVVPLRATTGVAAVRMRRTEYDYNEGPGDLIPETVDLVVRREVGEGRVLWTGWTGLITATRRGNETAGRLLANMVTWLRQGVDLQRTVAELAGAEGGGEEGPFMRAFDARTPPRTDNVTTLLCHYTGREGWYNEIGGPEAFAQWLADRNVEVVRINVYGRTWSIYPLDLPGPVTLEYALDYLREHDRDLLPDLLAELHECGIRLIGDYNHPHHLEVLPPVVDAEGKPHPKLACWLRPEFAERSLAIVRKLFGETDLDGIVIEDDGMPLCFCEGCLAEFRDFCREQSVEPLDPREFDLKERLDIARLYGRFRGQAYYDRILRPMREAIHRLRPGAKLCAWVGRWMREASTGYDRYGLAGCTDALWHMAYLRPEGVHEHVSADLALAGGLIDLGAAIRPFREPDNLALTPQCLSAALQAGAQVVGTYPEFTKAGDHPAHEATGEYFARAEHAFADWYLQRLASLGDVVIPSASDQPLAPELQAALARSDLVVRQVALYTHGRRIAPFAERMGEPDALALLVNGGFQAEDLTAIDSMATQDAGLLVQPGSFGSRPELTAGGIMTGNTLQYEPPTGGPWPSFGERVVIGPLSLRADHPAVAVDRSLAVGGSVARVQLPGHAQPLGRTEGGGEVLAAAQTEARRVVAYGGDLAQIADQDRGTLVAGLLRWLVAAEYIQVESRELSGDTATVTFTNAGKAQFRGWLGIGLPAAALAQALALDGQPVEAQRMIRHGPLRHLYVRTVIQPGDTATLQVRADRSLEP